MLKIRPSTFLEDEEEEDFDFFLMYHATSDPGATLCFRATCIKEIFWQTKLVKSNFQFLTPGGAKLASYGSSFYSSSSFLRKFCL